MRYIDWKEITITKCGPNKKLKRFTSTKTMIQASLEAKANPFRKIK